jgi:hypothetical protein
MRGTVRAITYASPGLPHHDDDENEGFIMCDLAYVNLLREKVRQIEAEEKRMAAFGGTPSTPFVPFVLTPVEERATDSKQTNGRV